MKTPPQKKKPQENIILRSDVPAICHTADSQSPQSIYFLASLVDNQRGSQRITQTETIATDHKQNLILLEGFRTNSISPLVTHLLKYMDSGYISTSETACIYCCHSAPNLMHSSFQATLGMVQCNLK